jgi:lipopolysaccharide transport system ATP-binding protein
MSDIVIRVENLGKEYRIGVQERYYALRDTLSDLFKAPWRFLTRRRAGDHNDKGRQNSGAYIWAVKDVSFQVQRGEVVGIIGRNGAGKSTLLKLLTRITEPTAGLAQIKGRVGSLLEVGTGFHPELTGRENIFLNGAILGMKSEEITRKFDEIVDFAGVAKFIDTPVKRYSSGMYVRLAFAVAAHLESEILLIDEVLAVGDAEFQKKCLAKIQDESKSGRTILFVSHNMGSIRRFCERCLWLHEGRLKQEGETAAVVEAYLADCGYTGGQSCISFPEDPGKPSQMLAARFLNNLDGGDPNFSCDEPTVVELTYLVREQLRGLYGCFEIDKSDGTPVMVSYSLDWVPNPLEDLAPGVYSFQISIPPRTLAAGSYTVHFSTAAKSWGPFIVEDQGIILSFSLEDVITQRGNRRLGYFSTLLPWQVEEVSQKPNWTASAQK